MGRRKGASNRSKPVDTASAKKARLLKGQEDPTPESSNVDDSGPKQVCGSGRGCNLCFPTLTCSVDTRGMCVMQWTADCKQATDELQALQQKQNLLEKEAAKEHPCKQGNNEAARPVPSQQLPTKLNFNSTSSQGQTKAAAALPVRKCTSCQVTFNSRPGTRSRGVGQESIETQCQECKKANNTPTPINQLSSTSNQRHTEKIKTECVGATKQKPENKPVNREENSFITIEISDSESEDERFEHTVVSDSDSSNTANVKAERNGKKDSRENILEATTCSEMSSSDSSSDESSSGRSSWTEMSAAQPDAIIADPCMAELEQDAANLTASCREEEEEEHNSSKVTEADVTAAKDEGYSSKEKEEISTSKDKDWRNVSSLGYISQYLHLLHHQLYTDCSFNLRDERGNIKNFRCHKVVLARGSQVFADLLFEPNAEQSENIVLVGIEHEAFMRMLEFIYSGSVTIKCLDLMLSVCKAACRFQVAPLVNQCSEHLGKAVTPQQVCKVIHFASKNHLVQLQEACLRVVRDNTLEVLKSPGFLQSTTATLHLMLFQPYLRISSELEIVEACRQWAELEARNRGLQGLTLGEVLGVPKQLIRFLTLSPAQFAEGPAKSDLLTQEEKLAIFMALASPSQQCTLPNGLSNNRNHRNL